MLMGDFKAVIISTDFGELLYWKVKYSRPRNKLLGLSVRGRWIDSEGWEQFCKFTFWYVLWFCMFFWIMLTNFCFQSPNQRLGFFFYFGMLRVGWERNLPGSEANYIYGSSYVSKLFFPSFIIRFVEVESCRELCSLNGGVFFFLPPKEFEQPRSVSALLFWVDPSFTFPGVVGGSLILWLDVTSLLCLIKENRWIRVNWIVIPFSSKTTLVGKGLWRCCMFSL